MRRLIALLEISGVLLAAGFVTLGVAAGPARAVAPVSAVSAAVPVGPPPISQQVDQALSNLRVEIGRPHAGTAEVLTHPEKDSTGSTVLPGIKTGSTTRRALSVQPQVSVAGQPGLDVSSYQPNVNWTSVVGHGATFVYIKATENINYTSPSFNGQYTGSTAAGLIRGGYHFAIPNNSVGAAQADYFVAHGGGWSPDGRTLPGMLDIESNPYGPMCYGLNPAQMIAWITSFTTEYRRLTTRWPDIYTSTYWWTTCTGNSASFGQDSLSIANWNASPLPLPRGWATYTFWQWADAGTFPGDQETFNGNRLALTDFANGAVAATASTSVAGGFTALSPVRVLDTRTGNGAPARAIRPGQQVTVQIAGTHGVPSTGVGAVTVNLTVTGATRPGYLTAYADGTTRPLVSNLNFTPGATVADLAVVPVGGDGKVTLYNGSAGTVQILADLAGYDRAGGPTAPGAYAAVGPVRVLDTRTGNGAPAAAIGPGQQVRVQIAGTHGVPSTGVGAVTVNVTATEPTRPGYLTAYADGTTRPLVSDLNFLPGTTLAGFAVVPVGADGKVTFYNGSTGTVHIVADLAGYYLAGHAAAAGTMQTVPPRRILDTRTGLGGPKTPIPVNGSLTVQISGTAGIPSSGVSAVVAGVTVVTPASSGYLTAYPAGTSRPIASNIDFPAHTTVANLVVVPLDRQGRIQLSNISGGTANVLVDIAGFYLS